MYRHMDSLRHIRTEPSLVAGQHSPRISVTRVALDGASIEKPPMDLKNLIKKKVRAALMSLDCMVHCSFLTGS